MLLSLTAILALIVAGAVVLSWFVLAGPDDELCHDPLCPECAAYDWAAGQHRL